MLTYLADDLVGGRNSKHQTKLCIRHETEKKSHTQKNIPIPHSKSNLFLHIPFYLYILKSAAYVADDLVGGKDKK